MPTISVYPPHQCYKLPIKRLFVVLFLFNVLLKKLEVLCL